MEVGGVPPGHVRRRSDRRLGLHGEERLLEAGGDQSGDLAVATHCSPLANNERGNSNGSTSADASGTAASKSYSLEHRIQRVSTPYRRHPAAQRSCRGLFGCRGSVFAAAECVDQKIGDSMPRDLACPSRVVVDNGRRNRGRIFARAPRSRSASVPQGSGGISQLPFPTYRGLRIVVQFFNLTISSR